MTSPAPDFSVIVLFGRGRLDPCLPSLLAQTESSFEIICVINFKEPAAPDPRVRFLKITELNPSKRRNNAVAISRGKFLAFIDDDATAPPDWLDKARTFFELKPEAAGFGGPNIAPEKMSRAEQIVDLILTDQYLGSGSGSYRSSGDTHPARPGELHAANLFIRREFFDQVKGFNEKIGYGGEDSELVYQISKKTGRVLEFIPKLFVYHKRREFGKELLKRNFRFRSQNGRMMWVYPDMYKWNLPLWTGLFFMLTTLLLSIFIPWGFLVILFLAALYYSFIFFSSLARLKTNKVLCFSMPFYYFLHHCSYALGIFTGLGEGLFMGRKKLSALLARDDLE